MGVTVRNARVLPRGRNAAPRPVVWASQQERMLEAMAAAVAEKGYAHTAVADVIERAGVSRKTFYEHFDNKEACFLVAYDAGVELLLGAIEHGMASARGGTWLDRARTGTTAYLDALVEHEGFARAFLVEVLAAGPEALARRALVHDRFAQQLKALHAEELPGRAVPPDHVFRAAVGGVNELVTRCLMAHGPERLPSLVDEVLDVELSLLLGHEAARALRDSG